MATLTAYESSLDGVALTADAADSEGDEFVNTGREIIRIKNDSASEITVTITGQNASNFNVTTNATVSIAAGSSKVIGPFLGPWFDDADAKVQVSYSAAADVNIYVIKCVSPIDAL